MYISAKSETLTLPDGLNQTTHECRAPNNAKKKTNKHIHTPGDEQVLENPTELDRGQFTPKLLLFLNLFFNLTLIYLTGLIGYSLISMHVKIWSFCGINSCRFQEMI